MYEKAEVLNNFFPQLSVANHLFFHILQVGGQQGSNCSVSYYKVKVEWQGCIGEKCHPRGPSVMTKKLSCSDSMAPDRFASCH